MGRRPPSAAGRVPPGPPAARTPLPAGFGLEPDAATERLDDDRVLLGGSPLRLLRLRPRAAGLVGRWAAGEALGDDPAEGRLARRLVATGIFVPRPPGGGLTPADVTVVVPVRDRPAMLERLLDGLGPLAVVVVDDASVAPEPVARVARAAGATYRRLERHGGPGAARNAGLADVRSPVVAFVDSDCLPDEGWLEPLLDQLADPRVAAVAPRVVPSSAGRMDGFPSSYEAVRSPLDRGSAPGLVGPGGRVPFVPTAALVARRSALGDPCFDESLDGGEDVDLVWRLVAAGWDVRYQPAVVVRHEQHRRALGWASRRFFYGTTAGPLAERHGAAVAPVSMSVWSAASIGLLAARRPVPALLVNGLAIGLLARRLRGLVDDPLAVSVRLAGRGTLQAAAASIAGLARVWGPWALLAVAWRRSRPAALALLVGPALADWRSLCPAERPAPGGYVLAHVADDLAYGAGVWWGALRRRTLRPLLPRVVLRSRTWAADTLRRRVDT
jgi:mycofactocin system glycosyltransferase